MRSPFVACATALAAFLLMEAAPATWAQTPGISKPDAPLPLLSTPEAVDSHSYARPQLARVTHLDLDLKADFAARVMSGTAGLTLAAGPGVHEVILDTVHLLVTGIQDDAGKPLPYEVGADDEEKGAPLTVQIGAARHITIAYSSSPGARALSWLEPSMTPGKAKPYLYSQGEDINNRSWMPTQDSPAIRQSWTASITVPAGLVAVMSGERLTPEGEPVSPGWHRYRFRMDRNVPPYLIALAVGDLAFKPLGPRTGVYADPAVLESAGRELADLEKLVEAGERLFGPYRWGVTTCC